ncbi:MAG: hydrogenase maturation protease [Rhodoferax sp.]|nr:hydrogenase maturation protease [Rhodoferax sp.]MBP9060446.1 hydrogenase maturation protease [Rhodoferax sp.]MBP9684273.1 hydrogenase maturation protease [Rhodoferax sp.]
MNSAIICIGNRLMVDDSAGLMVYDQLKQRCLPDTIEVIEGGLMGLNLLPFLERGGRVVFVDNVRGFTRPGSLIVLNQAQVIATGAEHYDHNSCLAYVLSVLPKVCEGTLAQDVVLLGIEGPPTERLVQEAANLSVFIAQNGHP